MSTIVQIKLWNTTQYDRYEVINVNFSLPIGLYTQVSQLTNLAAQNPIDDGLNYILQSKPYGPRYSDGSIKKVTAWFAVKISAGEINGSGSRGSDRYPYEFLREKIVNIIDTGGVTVSWSPDGRFFTANNEYGLFSANGNIDQSTSLQLKLRYAAKELYYNYSDYPAMREVVFKPLQNNIDGTLSDAEEIDIDTVGSVFSRAWKTRIRYYPENNGGSVREPTLWAWFIIEIPNFGMMAKFWLQYGYGVIRENDNKRNNGNNSWLTTRGIQFEVIGPGLQWLFENHKIPLVTQTSSQQITTTITDLIRPTIYSQQNNVRAAGTGSGQSATTIFTFPQPHGIPIGSPVYLVDFIRNDNGSYAKYRDQSVATSPTEVTTTGENVTFNSARVNVVKEDDVLIHNGHSQCVSGYLFFYIDTSNQTVYQNANNLSYYNSILAIMFEQGDHPLMWSSTCWVDHRSYCAFGVVKKIPAHYTSEQTAREDAVIIDYNKFISRRGVRDPWQTEYHGGAPRTGVAGGQPEFGSSKCGHMARCAIPDTRTLMIDIMQEACRMHHYREHDAKIMNPTDAKYRRHQGVYSDVVFNNGLNYYHRGSPSWQHGLGENANIEDAEKGGEPNAAGGWQSIQNLHWAWNAMGAAGHLVADRWFREAEVKDAENVWILGKPVPTIEITNNFVSSVWGPSGADRSEYRYVLTLCQLYQISGKADLIQKLIDRADYILNWAINVNDSVYDPDKVSFIEFGDAGNWAGPTTQRSAIPWMGNMVHHMYAAVITLNEYGDLSSAAKYQKIFTRIGRSNILSFFRKNSQTGNTWKIHYYSDYDWDPSIVGRRQDPNIYPQCWIAASGQEGVSQNNPLTGRAFNFLYNGGLLMWGVGTNILLWELMQSDSELMTRLYDMLQGPGNFFPSPTSEERKGQSGWGKTWGDNYDDWVSVIEDPYMTRSLNSTIVQPDLLIDDWVVYDAGAPLVITPNLITSSFTIFEPTIKTGTTVSPDTLVEAITIFEPTVNTRFESRIDFNFEIFEPTIAAGTIVRPDPIIWVCDVITNNGYVDVSAGNTIPIDGNVNINPTIIIEEFEILEPRVRIGVVVQVSSIESQFTIFDHSTSNVEDDYIRVDGVYSIRHHVRGLMT